MIRKVKGTRDILPPESRLWVAVEAVANRIFGGFGYEEIRVPMLEPTELFVRSVGEDTDIVSKEMYTFADRKGRSLTLRPEGTAGVARAYIENGLGQRPQPLRLSYLGPMFRYEKMQRGRYRQFAQIGIELIGASAPQADVEVLLRGIQGRARTVPRGAVCGLPTSVGCQPVTDPRLQGGTVPRDCGRHDAGRRRGQR
jgi:histidyl-tRNA synthetase